MAELNKIIGAQINTSPTAVLSAQILVGSSTSVALSAALVVSDLDRISLKVTNMGNKDLWVKLQAAAVDNDKKGQLVPAGASQVIFQTPIAYAGEVSGIMNSGGTMPVLVEVL